MFNTHIMVLAKTTLMGSMEINSNKTIAMEALKAGSITINPGIKALNKYIMLTIKNISGIPTLMPNAFRAKRNCVEKTRYRRKLYVNATRSAENLNSFNSLIVSLSFNLRPFLLKNNTMKSRRTASNKKGLYLNPISLLRSCCIKPRW